MDQEKETIGRMIANYFDSRPDFSNRFFSPAEADEISVAEEVLKVILPEDYKRFLSYSNGFEGFINGYYLRLIPVGYLYENTQDYCSETRPWAIYLGTNGGGEMVVLDSRSTPMQFGLLPYLGQEEDFIALGDSFQSFIASVYNDEIFE
ncbi:MAG: SMI1/KNR4 family protein [Hymenobacter sp.]|nr:MAG: SMI1/KNR4 family protein [Hymenobacter sp.]